MLPTPIVTLPDRLPPDPVIERYKQDVDVTLIRACLKRTPEERLVRLQNAVADVAELQRAMRESKARADTVR
jgi:hypothetical protein